MNIKINFKNKETIIFHDNTLKICELSIEKFKKKYPKIIKNPIMNVDIDYNNEKIYFIKTTFNFIFDKEEIIVVNVKNRILNKGLLDTREIILRKLEKEHNKF